MLSNFKSHGIAYCKSGSWTMFVALQRYENPYLCDIQSARPVVES
jgi:hypothetical protein